MARSAKGTGAPKPPGVVVDLPVRRQPNRYGKLGRWEPSQRYLFGSGAEAVDSREPAAKYQPREEPERNQRPFQVIRPGVSGQNANEPKLTVYSARGGRGEDLR